jgi:hypothetical protein
MFTMVRFHPLLPPSPFSEGGGNVHKKGIGEESFSFANLVFPRVVRLREG